MSLTQKEHSITHYNSSSSRFTIHFSSSYI